MRVLIALTLRSHRPKVDPIVKLQSGLRHTRTCGALGAALAFVQIAAPAAAHGAVTVAQVAPTPSVSAGPGMPAGVSTAPPGAAPASPAPAPTTSAAPLAISIFGVGHLSADSLASGAASDYLHSSSSRLGIKGDYGLGNGNSVLFQYETGVDLTGAGVGDGNGGANSQGQLFTRTRDSYVGFKGAFGSVLFGRLGGLNQWLYTYNLFADQVGDLGNIFGGDGLPGRLDHALLYQSPNLGGVSLGLTYAPNQGTRGSSSFIANGLYEQGRVKAGAAYASFGGGPKLLNTTATAITGAYDFGTLSLGGGFQHETNIGGISNADRNKYTFGTTVKLGANGTVKALFASAGDLNGVPHSGANQSSFGYDYALGKTTTIYAAYARTSNDLLGAYSAFDYGHGNNGAPAIVPGNSPSGVSLGVVFKFNAPLVKH